MGVVAGRSRWMLEAYTRGVVRWRRHTRDRAIASAFGDARSTPEMVFMVSAARGRVRRLDMNDEVVSAYLREGGWYPPRGR